MLWIKSLASDNGIIKIESLLLLFAVATILASCRSHEDITENYFATVEQMYEKTFYDEFGIVGSAQDWNTVASRNLNLELGDLTGETCDIKVFTTDPREEENDSRMVAEYLRVPVSQKYEYKIDAPASCDSLYVFVRHDGKAEIYPVKVEENGDLNIRIDSITHPEDFLYYLEMQYLFVYEDLGIAIDLDFNDVVLGVTYVSGKNTAKMRLQALGTTLNTYLYFNNEELFSGREVHEFYGISNNTLINCFAPSNRFPYKDRQNSKFLSSSYAHTDVILNLPDGFSLSENADMLYIKTSAFADPENEYAKTIVVPKKGGEFPHAMLIADPKWEWPSETVSIVKAYPEFKNWVADPKYKWY